MCGGSSLLAGPEAPSLSLTPDPQGCAASACAFLRTGDRTSWRCSELRSCTSPAARAARPTRRWSTRCGAHPRRAELTERIAAGGC
jgi:hypothetical protein